MWPARSLITGEQVAGPGLIAPEDWAKLTFISGVVCRRCGTKLEAHVPEDSDCPACIARPPTYSRARAAMIYNDHSRSIILRLKHGGDRSGLDQVGRWMAEPARGLVEEDTLLVPVPLHYRRLVSRGFNQSQWLAAALGREIGAPVSPHALKRMRPTPSQAGQSARARRRNVRGAFKPGWIGRRVVKDRSILLVDDVLTTGATVDACASALERAGARRVDVVTLMRVARPVDPTI